MQHIARHPNADQMPDPSDFLSSAYSGVTGTWASLGVAVDTGDTFLVDTNVALVAQPTRNALRAFSAITGGAWNSLVVPVDTGDTFLVDTNVALVAQPTQNQLRAYSAVTGTWASLGVAVDAGDAFKVGGDTQ
jgi:hypothetical protein